MQITTETIFAFKQTMTNSSSQKQQPRQKYRAGIYEYILVRREAACSKKIWSIRSGYYVVKLHTVSTYQDRNDNSNNNTQSISSGSSTTYAYGTGFSIIIDDHIYIQGASRSGRFPPLRSLARDNKFEWQADIASRWFKILGGNRRLETNRTQHACPYILFLVRTLIGTSLVVCCYLQRWLLYCAMLCFPVLAVQRQRTHLYILLLYGCCCILVQRFRPLP